MLLRSFFSQANVHSATRTPIPTDLLNQWQKRVGKKRAKSTPYKSPSPIDESDSESDIQVPLGRITPLIKYTTRSSLAALPGGEVNIVAGPSNIHHSQSNLNGTQETTRNWEDGDVFEIDGTYFNRYSELLN